MKRYIKSSYPDVDKVKEAHRFLVDGVDYGKVRLVEECREAILSCYSERYGTDEDGNDIDHPISTQESDIIRDYKSIAAEEWVDCSVEEADKLFDKIMQALEVVHADDAASWT